MTSYARAEFENGGVNGLENGRVNAVKTLKFDKGGGCISHDPPSSYGGAAPGHTQ